jgi:diguanylate cyclase (GGDEF)-like protein
LVVSVGQQVPAHEREAGIVSKEGGLPSFQPIHADLAAVVDRLDYSFQPIVAVATGQCFGYEALLRDHQADGFDTPKAFFDACHAAGRLADVQIRLWERAISKFAGMSGRHGARLFINVDSRSLDGRDVFAHHLKGLLAHYDVPESAVALEISEPPPAPLAEQRQWIKALRRNSCKIAIDRCGSGVASFEMLHAIEPDFLKLDPFFVRNLHQDSRKRLLASQMVSVAHLLGMLAVAVGVETDTDFLTCKEIGCDLVQGHLIAPPQVDLGNLQPVYRRVEELSRQDRRVRDSDRKIILDQMATIPPLSVEASVTALFERLRNDPQQTFVPVVDHLGQPVGIVRESNIKNYAYSPFGKALIENKGLGRRLKDFIVRCPIAEVHMSVENIMSIYSGDEEAEGIILVDQMRYVGFLSARSIIRVINEKSLAQARDQNPLTKLPGNALINDYVADSLRDLGHEYVYSYIDFDNFKPFNDKYGFRQGDRAILLFAELMRKSVAADRAQGHFLGHIGGDDFFIGFRGFTAEQAAEETKVLLDTFGRDAESFYSKEDRANGCIIAADREGNRKRFPLLSASAVLVEMPKLRSEVSVDDVSSLIAGLKKEAKWSPSKMAIASLGG